MTAARQNEVFLSSQKRSVLFGFLCRQTKLKWTLHLWMRFSDGGNCIWLLFTTIIVFESLKRAKMQKISVRQKHCLTKSEMSPSRWLKPFHWNTSENAVRNLSKTHFRTHIFLFPKIHQELLTTGVSSVLRGPCKTVESQRNDWQQCSPCSSVSPHILGRACWALQALNRSITSLGTSPYSLNISLFILVYFLNSSWEKAISAL